MLNGQLQLTDIALARPCRACAVRFISWAPSAWPSWPVALQGPARPVVDMAGGQQTTATAQPGGSYVVKPGDTLYKIARSNNVDVENVKRWNNLSDPNQISVGQVLAVRRRRRGRRRDAGHAGGVCQVVLDAAAPA